MSRKAVNRLYENKAQLNSISMHLGESVAIARTVGHLSKSAEVMKLVNNLMKAPQMAATMQEFSKEMIKVIFKFVTLLHLRASFCFIIFTIVVNTLELTLA
ncbi:hypothetical protein Goarm_004020 [Gossypium armourianum]|uniref:Uncharacterized protein n=1 Tax=Gossypium armourianum TaxID=34283 RepID=A0A7J9K533_9ROSI|nr:hypothetical protein [Gossypium armourianum]